MSPSPETILVLISNGITAIIAAALFLLVLWQAPQRRTNQALAVMMFCMALYSTLNAVARFADVLDVPIVPFWYLLLESYGLFIASTLLFVYVYMGIMQRPYMIFLGVIVISSLISFTFVQTGQSFINFRPGGGGSYAYSFGRFFWWTAGVALITVLAAVWITVRSKSSRGREIAPALLLILGGFASSVIHPFGSNFPLNSILLTSAAFILGRAILRSQLFNPLAELNAQLVSKNRELADAGRLKSQFLSNMSYELRTPLNAIIGYTGLVIDGTYGPISDKQSNRLQKVISNSHHLLVLIDDILDLNQIEAGRVVLKQKAMPTTTLLDETLAVIEPLAAKKSLTLTRPTSADLPVLWVDEQRARQILLNVLSNAVKFTPSGGITVRVQKVDTRFLQIEVEDSGIGIPADQQAAVFEEFRQVDGSSTREFQGTGLGLAITRRLVAMHGGRIWLSSEPGKGTTVFITLPIAAEALTPNSALPGEEGQRRSLQVPLPRERDLG